MSATEMIDQLKHLSNVERLAVIEAATRLIREEFQEQSPNANAEDPMLRVAGCLSGAPLSAAEIEQELYGGEQP
jgi:hypothetical protein